MEISREYKQSLTSSPAQSHVSLVSLFDLLFYYDPDLKPDLMETKGFYAPRFVNNVTTSRLRGQKLSHTTILFDGSMYRLPADFESSYKSRLITPKTESEAADTEKTGTLFSEWAIRGFDVSLPKYDPRAKPITLTKDSITDYITVDKNGYALDGTVLVSENTADAVNRLRASFDATCKLFPEMSKDSFTVYPRIAAIAPKNAVDCVLQSPSFSGVTTAEDWSLVTQYMDWPVEGDATTISMYQPLFVGLETDLSDDNYLPGSISGSDVILTAQDTTFSKRFLDESTSHLKAFNSMLLNYSSPRVWRLLQRAYSTVSDLQTFDKNSPLSSIVVTEGINFVDFYGNTLSDNMSYVVLAWLLKHTYVWVRCPFFADYIRYEDFGQQLGPDQQVAHRSLLVSKDANFAKFDDVWTMLLTEYKKDDDSLTTYTPAVLASDSRPYIPQTTPNVDLVSKALWEWKGSENLIKAVQRDEAPVGSLPTEGVYNTSFPYFDPFSTVEQEQANPVLMPRDGNLFVDGRIVSPTIDELWNAIKRLAEGKGVVDPSIKLGEPAVATANSPNESTRFSLREYPIKKNADDDESITVDPLEIKYISDSVKALTPIAMNWVKQPTTAVYTTMSEVSALIEQLIALLGDSYKLPEGDTALSEISSKYELEPHGVLSNRELEAQIYGLRHNLRVLLSVLCRNFVPVGKVNSSESDQGSLHLLHKDSYNSDSMKRHSKAWVDAAAAKEQLGSDIAPPTTASKVPAWAVYLGADGQWHSTAQACLIPTISETW